MINLPLKPENSRFTDAQWQSVWESGENLLISASAGSGKTTVLVERVIQKVLSGINVDELLIVTFTEAAASEMKERLENKLKETIEQELDGKKRAFLLHQLQLLPQAHISTLHAFCKRVIERFYYLIDLDPKFRLMSDETEKSLLKEQIFHVLREKMYEVDGVENESFYQLTENFSGDRNDEGLQSLVFSLMDFALSHPAPDEYLDSLVKGYEINGDFTESTLYQEILKPQLLDELFVAKRIAKELENLARSIEFDKMLEQSEEILLLLERLTQYLEQDNVEEIYLLGKESKFPRKISANSKAFKEQEDIVAPYGSYHARLKEVVDGIFKQKIFTTPPEVTAKVLGDAKEVVETLVVVTKSFMQEFQQEKFAKNALDFSDLEHLALKILRDDSGNPSEASLYYKEKFHEVMIDEYQDTNGIQEMIANFVSKENNRFMVGDVKQSIYMFRQADPTLFIEKYTNYGENNGGKRIVLAENFRSRSDVLDFTNLIFMQLMNRTLGQIEYDDAARLINGNTSFPENEQMKTEILIYETQKDEEQEVVEIEPTFDVESKNEGEITLVAMKIREMVENGFEIYDKDLKTNRLLEYKDIVLLAPTRKHNAEIQEMFARFDIPLVMNDVATYFKTTEIRMIMSLLSIIDNPYQDIPLASVLRSPIVNLNEEELARVRLNNKTGNFYEAVQDTKNIQKLEVFKKQLNAWRNLARSTSIHLLLWKIYEETAIIEIVSGMPNGHQREANLYALAERAEQYEQSSFKGLFQFVRFIERMRAKDEDLAETEMENLQNAVRVMTIHGSKGLEFPVVFLLDLSKKWNLQDIQGKTIFDGKLGVGIQYLDRKSRLKFTTLVFEAIKAYKKKKILAEEMRKLYVALTRAEQKLILVASYKDKETALKTWSQAGSEESEVLSETVRLKGKSVMDWIGMTLMRHKDADVWNNEFAVANVPTVKYHATNFEVTFMCQQDLLVPEVEKTSLTDTEEKKEKITPEIFQRAKERLNFHYRYQKSTNTAVYQSVSEIKQVFVDPDFPNLLEANVSENGELRANIRFGELAKPAFLEQRASSVSSREIGSATHLLLQTINLSQEISEQALEKQLELLVERKLIEKIVAERIDLTKILQFFETSFGQLLQENSENVKKEVPFSLLVHPSEVYEDYPDEIEDDLLIHGIIDGYFEGDEGLVLFDYKTDFIRTTQKEREIEKMKERYAGQLNLYAKALQLATGKQVVRKELILLSIGDVVQLP
ncbi:helicase-exonuclease AddAB subunit AddA [Pilibacter termitis]|nr:helicase-exonuclease AddAB subunit AddA [Pilibacter termitis]